MPKTVVTKKAEAKRAMPNGIAAIAENILKLRRGFILCGHENECDSRSMLHFRLFVTIARILFPDWAKVIKTDPPRFDANNARARIDVPIDAGAPIRLAIPNHLTPRA